MKKTRAKIWQMGLVYIRAIYLAYLLIGLGIAQAIVMAGAPHLMAKIGAYLVIALGGHSVFDRGLPFVPHPFAHSREHQSHAGEMGV